MVPGIWKYAKSIWPTVSARACTAAVTGSDDHTLLLDCRTADQLETGTMFLCIRVGAHALATCWDGTVASNSNSKDVAVPQMKPLAVQTRVQPGSP